MGKNIKVNKSAIITYNDTTLDYIKEIKNYPKLSQSEELELFQLNTPQAKNKIIKSNLRFVNQVANKYIGMGIDLEDLIAFGRIGLIEAIDKFDPKRGNKFITFAVWYIRAEIQKSLNELSRTVRIPNHHKEKPKSHSIEDDEDIKELTQPTKKSKLDKEDTNWIINTALNQIKPKEKEAITRFYGIGWDFPQDMEYIGEAMNISQERVRQLIRRGEVALRQIKNIELLKEIIG